MMMRKNTRRAYPRGEKHHSARISEAEAREILAKLAAGETQQSIADRYGIERTTVSCIARGVSWKHLRRPSIPKRAGSRSPRSKLKEQDIPIIREALRRGWSYRAIAKEFSVSTTTIFNIQHGKTWVHVPDAPTREEPDERRPVWARD